MKKKGVNILAILAIVVILVIVGLVVFLTRGPSTEPNSNGGRGGETWELTVLCLETADQFRSFAQEGEYECHIGEDLSGGSVYKVPLLGEETIATYYFDQQGNTTDMHAFYFLNSDITDEENMEIRELTTEELAREIREALDKFCMMFNCSPTEALYLSNADDTYSRIESDEDFRAIAEDGARLIFSIRAKDGYFWELTISAAEELVSVNICKYFNKEESMSYVANISLYEEE